MTNRPMYVYILCDYGEDGPENMTATLDRSSLLDMIEQNWPRPTDEGHNYDRVLESHMDWKERGIRGLQELLKKSDEELSSTQSGWDCHSGWGGMQLHVVRLV